jgi:kynureninase
MSPEFDPIPGAGGYQHSNPPVFSSLPLIATLEIIDKAGGIDVLREKSERLTGYFWDLLTSSKWYRGVACPDPQQEREQAQTDRPPSSGLTLDEQAKGFKILTPSDPAQRGCQLSLLVLPQGSGNMDKVFQAMVERGVVGDERRPDVMRLSAVPLYNRFVDVKRAAEELERAFEGL